MKRSVQVIDGKKEMCTRFFLSVNRALAIASAAFALYVGIGCLMFGPWWYSWLYEGKLWDPQSTLDGLKDLVDYAFPVVVVIFVAVFLAVVLGWTWKAHLIRFLDRFGRMITFISAWMVVFAVVIVFHVYHPKGPDTEALSDEMVDQISNQIQNLTSLPAVQTPIDFQYLDNKRVDALYSQLEPELVEKQRTVADTATRRAKLGINAGPATAEAGFENGKASTSSYSRADFSSERKCVEVMQYIVENKTARYYTTSDMWMRTYETILLLMHIKVDWIVRRPKEEKQPTETEKRKAEDRQRNQTEDALLSELRNLRGLVFLDSVFDTPAGGIDEVLVAEFSTELHRIFFRVNVPVSVRRQILTKTRLRVFGDVTRGLTSDGYVDIRAIAVY